MFKPLGAIFAITALTLLLFAVTPAVSAQSENAYEDIPAATLAPNSTFYFIQSWREAFEGFVANLRSNEDKANLQMEFARRRVAEMRTLANLEGQEERIIALQERWQEHITRMQELAEQTEENREENKERFLEQLDRHRTVMESVREQVPDKAKAAIDRSLENYETNRARLLENFTGERRQEIEERLRERLENTIDRFELNRERFQKIIENRQSR